MASISYLLLLSMLFFSYCSADLIGQSCTGNYTTDKSEISKNIDKLLTKVAQNIDTNPFIATTIGKGESQAYVLAQCKGYASSTDCSSCIHNATRQIRQLCDDRLDARVWYEYCFLRYSNEDFFGKVDTSWSVLLANVESVTDPKSFNKALGKLFDKVDTETVKPGSPGYAEGEIKLSPFITLYAFAQCTRDLSKIDCAQCLATAIGNFQGFCSDSKGCQVFYSTCYVRYEEYPFFSPSASQKVQVQSRKALIYP
ncbi:hypothetical protein Ancab_022204 [Ancistrocladus abbreviatus]